MRQLYKFSSNYFFATLLPVLLFCTQTWKTGPDYTSGTIFYRPLTNSSDTPPAAGIPKTLLTPGKDSLQLPDSVRNSLPLDTPGRVQRVDTFDIKMSKDTLDGPVNYEAEDSAVVMIKNQQIFLYGKTKTEYKDITLTAPKVEIDQQSQMLTAMRDVDSAGNTQTRAKFIQAENNFQSDTIRYNFKTQKGLTKNTFTQNGEFFVKADRAKRNGDVMYAANGVFTTCSYDEPHFGFHFNKLKVINNKLAVSGAIYPEFETVPIRFATLPFGMFPMNKNRHGGILPPQFTTNEKFGLGLEGLGYYFNFNNSPYVDLIVQSNIYSYGGWSLNLRPSYRKRYKYSGGLNFNYQSTKFNFKGDPDYVKSNNFQIGWNHSVDSRARPGVTFSANVNAGSSKYNQYVANNANINFNNTMSSSISYSKNWAGTPFNLTLSANHNQNNQQRLINVSLPDMGFTMNTIYPFQQKDFVGTPKWYQKLGIAYNGSFRSQFSFYDTTDFGQNGKPTLLKHLIDTLQWGAQHNIPITLSLPPIMGGAVLVSPSVSYQEKWIAQSFKRVWNSGTKKVDTLMTKGVFADRSASFGIGLSTALYGKYSFNGTQIRHVMRPTFSMNYKPDLSKNNFYRTQIDDSGREYLFSQFEGSLYGYYPAGKSGGIGFQIDNNLEMKPRKKKKKDSDSSGTPEEVKPIKLIDGYGISGGYNFLADSFKLSTFNLYLRSTLFEKISLTASATMNPYQVDANGFPVDKFAWQGGKFSPGRLTSGSISLSANFRSKAKDEKKDEEKKRRENEALNDPAMAADRQGLMEYMQRNPGEFVDFNVPWNLSVGFSLNFFERFKADYSGFEKEFSANANFNGDFNLTPKWKFGVNGYYNFDEKKLQTFSMNISREMHCWQMSIGVTPLGLYRFFNITINPKASVLQDLKINRTRTFNSY
jgi:LPS-assembly protein